MEYSKWLNLWLENYFEPSNKSRTCQRYRQIVVNHVIPFFENRDSEELSPLVLQQYVAGLLAHGNLKTGKGLAPNTVNAVISVVQNSLKTAHALGYAKEYSANMIKRPKTEEKKVECFTLVEQKKIESAVLNVWDSSVLIHGIANRRIAGFEMERYRYAKRVAVRVKKLL